MVVFTCNHCGESLRKPTVEKHYNFVCRRVKSLTCVDCFKDFSEEEYVSHTKCITEEERYAAKGSMPNGVVKKGELKQESWVDMIKSIINEEPNLQPSHKNLLSTISDYNNVPRKKPKFLNFIKSSSGGRVNMKDVEAVWNIIESYKIKNASQSKVQKDQSNEKKKSEDDSNKRKNSEDMPNSNVETEQPKKKKKKKQSETDENNKHLELDNDEPGQQKSKTEKQEDNPQVDDVEEIFDFKTKIISILESKTSLPLKKLEKKVLNAYLKHSGDAEMTVKVVRKFHKNLRRIPRLEVSENIVSLKET